MNTDSTLDRRERETERSEAHNASWPAPRRQSHRVLWIALLAVLTGLCAFLLLNK